MSPEYILGYSIGLAVILGAIGLGFYKSIKYFTRGEKSKKKTIFYSFIIVASCFGVLVELVQILR